MLKVIWCWCILDLSIFLLFEASGDFHVITDVRVCISFSHNQRSFVWKKSIKWDSFLKETYISFIILIYLYNYFTYCTIKNQHLLNRLFFQTFALCVMDSTISQCKIKQCFTCERSCRYHLCLQCKDNHVYDLKTIDHNVVVYKEKV